MIMENSKVGMVKDYIKKEIKAGRIQSGQRLPSCREVSARLSVNKITVNKAYNELEREHKVYSIPRGGFYLLDSEEDQRLVLRKVDFVTVEPDEKLIPYREFSHAINKAVDEYRNSLFAYESAGGLDSLRGTLKELFEKDGVYASGHRIIITNGAQQAIALIFQALFRSGKGKLLTEAPTYRLALSLAEHFGIEVEGIERHEDGFDYKELERILKTGEIKAFYIIPRHHNPTGYTLNEKGKQKIAELCNKYNVLIIEDDYLADLDSRKGCMPIHYYDISKRTIYIRSFSKTFMPGIRIGAAVLPEFMLEEVLRLKRISDLSTSRLSQAALDTFIKSGMYEKHIRKVRKAYSTKLSKASEIIKALSPGNISWHVPEQGIFIWLQLPEAIPAEALGKRLEQYGILTKPAGEFYPANWLQKNNLGGHSCIRLCISGVPEENINALGTIIAVIKSF
jgi:DNA-binding transcriptional MocR family regulator